MLLACTLEEEKNAVFFSSFTPKEKDAILPKANFRRMQLESYNWGHADDKLLLLEISKSGNFSSARYCYYSKLYFTHKNMAAASIWKKNSLLRPDHFSPAISSLDENASKRAMSKTKKNRESSHAL